MRRHKLIAQLNWNSEDFHYLKRNDLIVEEYEYHLKQKHNTGCIYQVKEKDDCTRSTYVAIASNYGKVYTTCWSGHRRRNTVRIMYHLKKEGFQYLKERMMEERV